MARVPDLYQVYIRRVKSEEWRIPKGAPECQLYTRGQANSRVKRARAHGYEAVMKCVRADGFGEGVYE